MVTRPTKPSVRPGDVENFLHGLFQGSIHAKRLQSLANAVTGSLHSASLALAAIGQGLAAANGSTTKHAVKQVDRLLSNPGLDLDTFFSRWVPFVIAQREHLVVNFDWTDFDASNHAMVVLGTQTHHGRSTPLLWKTVNKSQLRGKRNDHEDALLVRLRDIIETLDHPVEVTVVADRGFSDTKLYRFLTDDLGFDFIIRFRGVVHVTDTQGRTQPAKDWLRADGRLRLLRHAQVTAQRCPVEGVVCVQNKGMKDAWFLAFSEPGQRGSEIKARYGKRFTIEESFRDLKNPRFGLGLKQVKIKRCDRRDRLMLIAVLAHALLTILGQAGEEAGLDRLLKSNTSPRRQHSLFRQGLMWFDLIPNMPEQRLLLLMQHFERLLAAHPLVSHTFAAL